ncbi:kelch-like protein 22 isoform X1 [Synchiropus splendidus]|uniref:kelch-like protein 22 isoform X1 n=1 Tax=Synchiropus splendidus TaxID=270530 RepID=UPI00237E129E|nr:kelch-like protein 22 isoform X1 [Synchiropus splendidus]
MAEDEAPARLAAARRSSPQTFTGSSHFRSLLDNLLALRQRGVLFDVVLLVEEQRLPAHRILLAASCDYFRVMFAGGLREAQQTEIPIHGVSYKAMKKILDYIYTSRIELDLESAQEVLIAATLLQLEKVVGFCCAFLDSWLDESNILEMLLLADHYGLQQLHHRVHCYILANIQTLSRSEVYRRLPVEEVFQALCSDQLQVSSENEVFQAALHYHYSPAEVESDQVYLQVSQKDKLKMLDAVRFCLMEKQVLQRLHGRLVPCPLRDCVSQALIYHEEELMQPVAQGPLTQPRSTSYCILGFGGMYSSNSVIGSECLFQVFHPSWGEWRTLDAAPAPRMSNQGVAVLNNFVYLIGGDINTAEFIAASCCWRYDPRHNSWCSIESLSSCRADHCVCVLDGHIYAIGGRDYKAVLSSVERYDPHTNKWQPVAPLPRKVYAHAGATVQGKVYVTCGRRGSAYLKETLCYDPSADVWTECPDGPVGRAWHGAAGVNGRAYVIGGSNDQNGYRCDILKTACFDPSSSSWSVLSPLPAGHGEPGVAVMGPLIYVLGGRSHDKSNRMKYVHAYDTGADQWACDTEFRERVSGLAACVALMPPAVMARAKRPDGRVRALLDVGDIGDTDSSED